MAKSPLPSTVQSELKKFTYLGAINDSLSGSVLNKYEAPQITQCREGSVGIARGYGLDYQGLIPVKGERLIILLSTASRLVLVTTQPPIQRVPGVFPRGKADGS
jgi:hypothetical protein